MGNRVIILCRSCSYDTYFCMCKRRMSIQDSKLAYGPTQANSDKGLRDDGIGGRIESLRESVAGGSSTWHQQRCDAYVSMTRGCIRTARKTEVEQAEIDYPRSGDSSGLQTPGQAGSGFGQYSKSEASNVFDHRVTPLSPLCTSHINIISICMERRFTSIKFKAGVIP